MKIRTCSLLGAIGGLLAAGSMTLPLPATAQEADLNGEDFEVLTRGPVHEAFAESVSFDPQPGMIVDVAPPEPIEELPPDQKPEGDNVVWISGYWAWDEEQNDFLWISGIWRNLPPDRQWIPGYWSDLGDGRWQWTSGYWADAEVQEVAYLASAPPASIETGPNTSAPTADHTWIPGVWSWMDTRYVWRPGYWTPLRTNWTWVPSRYCWTPHGYVFVDGYWDYAVYDRGVLFAPVHFHRRVWARSGYHYTPSIVVTLDLFIDHLFYRPRSSHYYFGDYYEPRYRDAGFHFAFSWHRDRHGYDPIYAYERWHHRNDRHWDRHYRDRYDYRSRHADARPPHTWTAMRQLRARLGDSDRERIFARTFESFTADREREGRFQRLGREDRERIAAERREMRTVSQERRLIEARRAERPESRAVIREPLARSPIVGRRASQFERSKAPPARPETTGRRDERETVRGPTERDAEARKTIPQRQPEAHKAPARQPQARPAPAPQRQPEARKAPARQPQARPAPAPQRQPEARKAPARQPQARPAPAPQRQPEARKTPARERSSSPQESDSSPQSSSARERSSRNGSL